MANNMIVPAVNKEVQPICPTAIQEGNKFVIDCGEQWVIGSLAWLLFLLENTGATMR
jgi:hypothetical protein